MPLPAAARVVGDVAVRVGLRLLDERGRLIGGGAQHDRVVAALAHLLVAVEAEDLRRIREQRLGFGKHGWTLLAESLIESPRDLAGELEMRQLIPADRHDVPLAEQDVGGLVNGIRVHRGVDRGQPGRVDLFLDGRVAIQLAHADQRQKRNEELIERGNMTVAEDVGVAARRDRARRPGSRAPARVTFSGMLSTESRSVSTW